MSADAVPESAPVEPQQQEEAQEPIRFENRTTSDSDSDSDSDGPAEAKPATEWLATTRQKRSTAGNRMQSMLANEEPDSDLELLFAEDEDDRGFTDDDGADSDVQMDSSSDDEDDNKAGGDDELEGEKELEQQAKERRAAQRKRKAQAAIPAKFRKKVRIDDSKPSSVAASSPAPSVSTPQSQSQPAPRPKKKSERASWLPSVTDMPTRASSRKTTRLSKEQLHAQMEEREAKRLKQADQMAKKAARAAALKKPPMTQDERLREAELVERRNSKSLNRWEEAEKQREEERLAKLAALNNRTLKGPVLTFWSGTRQWDDSAAGKYVVMEEKPKRKREKKDKDSKGKEKDKSNDGDKVAGDAEACKANNKPGETPDQEPKATAINKPSESKEDTEETPETRETKAEGVIKGQPNLSAEATAPISETKKEPTSEGGHETIIRTTEESTPAVQSSSPEAALVGPSVDDEKTAVMIEPSDNESSKPVVAATASTEATSTSAQATAAPEAMDVSIEDPVAASSAKPDGDGDTTMAEDAEVSEPKPLSTLAVPVLASPSGPDAMDADLALVTEPSEADTTKSNELAPLTIGTPAATSGKDESSNTTSTSAAQRTNTPPATANPSAPVNTEVKANVTAIDAGEGIKPKAEGDKATSVAPSGTASEPPQPPMGDGDTAEKRAASTAIRNTIIFQNFDENAIRDKTVQTQILFGRKMNKLPKPSPAPVCVITNLPARYRDPETGLPFHSVAAYREIRRLIKGEYRWSRALNAWAGSASLAANGVPERFLNPDGQRSTPVKASTASATPPTTTATSTTTTTAAGSAGVPVAAGVPRAPAAAAAPVGHSAAAVTKPGSSAVGASQQPHQQQLAQQQGQQVQAEAPTQLLTQASAAGTGIKQAPAALSPGNITAPPLPTTTATTTQLAAPATTTGTAPNQQHQQQASAHPPPHVPAAAQVPLQPPNTTPQTSVPATATAVPTGASE